MDMTSSSDNPLHFKQNLFKRILKMKKLEMENLVRSGVQYKYQLYLGACNTCVNSPEFLAPQ